jgi:hypothetical protein
VFDKIMPFKHMITKAEIEVKYFNHKSVFEEHLIEPFPLYYNAK